MHRGERDHLLRMSRKERERAFIKNGSRVLEELVASCNGKPIPIRTFSYKELRKATNNFDPQHILDYQGRYRWYKGSLEGRIISIKKYREDFTSDYTRDEAFTDIAISAKMSAHKNILKLVGCCLETEIIILVYEFAGNCTLKDRIRASERKGEPIMWQSRLKIAKEIAHAIAYLHTAFSRPIIHRDIKLGNIFLDPHNTPKLNDFSFSIIIPEGEIHVEDGVCDTMAFICPKYFTTGCITEKTDVYSFGWLMLELLTGERGFDLYRLANNDEAHLLNYVKNRAINMIVDPIILAAKGGGGVDQQLQAVLNIGLMCTEKDPMVRPSMVDVTKELRRVEMSIL